MKDMVGWSRGVVKLGKFMKEMVGWSRGVVKLGEFT
jgi:hypothetical protein